MLLSHLHVIMHHTVAHDEPSREALDMTGLNHATSIRQLCNKPLHVQWHRHCTKCTAQMMRLLPACTAVSLGQPDAYRDRGFKVSQACFLRRRTGAHRKRVHGGQANE